MAFGRYAWSYYHASNYDRDDFRLFCQRQAARSEAIARAIHRRYVDRCLKLASDGASSGDVSIEQRGYTYGGAANTRTPWNNSA